jgi:hypothetical protein
MELQNKLKSKDTQSEAKQSSFITNKETLLIKEGKAHAYSHPNQPKQTTPQQNIPPQQSRPKQESVNMQSFWSPAGTQSASNGSGKFDAFTSFFPTSNDPAKKQNNPPADMYDEFFSEKPTKPVPASKPQSSNQVNLLDL